MGKSTNLNFIVEGHTNDMESSDDNYHLSQNRAESVVGCLANKGISSSRLVAKCYGTKRPGCQE
ncbi:uncharacterized protein Dvar_36480 [Desulfosarcina variabilis str. Montpellier]